MCIRNLIFGVSSVAVSYLIRYGSLLQNATDVITKCNSCFITICGRSLLQNASGFLLQNAKVLITKCDDFVTKCDSYYKCDDFITKCDVYYKLRQYIQHLTPLLDLICLILSIDENMTTTVGLLLKLF